VSAPARASERAPAVLDVRRSREARSARRYGDLQLLPNHAPLVAVLAMATILVALGFEMNHTTYRVWGAFWVAPVLLILSVPVANRAARHDGPAMGRCVMVAAAVKVLVAPPLRYWMAFSVYGGFSDSVDYHQAGVVLAPLFRHGIYQNLGQISGTRFLEIVTGQVYAFIGPTLLGGFMVFSWFAFIGCYLFHRAFRTAYPDGDGRRYALLVFFFPTMLFWPSSTGKEAFMILALGAAALGAAQLFAGRFRGLVWLALGLWGAAVVRPHMALIVGVGLVVAAPLVVVRGGTQATARRRGRLAGAVLILGLLVAGPALIGVAEKFFHLQSLNTQTAQEVLDETTRLSGKNGSTFTSVSPNNPAGFVLSGVTVLFRPFPFEVRNAQALLTSLEGLSLLTLGVLSFRRLARLPAEASRRPYLIFGLVYTLAFIYAFSALGNFGILARERSQLLPALFVLLCIPAAAPDRSEQLTH
jgi:hypothetical protein